MDLIGATDANDVDRVRELIADHVDLNVMDEDTDTALHIAAGRGFTEIAIALIEAGADVNSENDDHETPLRSAASAGAVQIGVALINAGANINARETNGDTPLEVAVNNRREDFIILLLEQANIDLSETVIDAVAARDLNILNLLLDAGADPNEQYRGTTPLVRAAHAPVEYTITLLQKGADVNLATDYWGTTPLMAAVEAQNIPLIEYLLSRPDLNIDADNINGQTALTIAAFEPNTDILKLIMNAGADPTIITTGGGTPLDAYRRTGRGEHSAQWRLLKQYQDDWIAAKLASRNTSVKRGILQKRITTGNNFPLQLPQKQLPHNILARAAYDELCGQLGKYNTKPQVQELARSLGIVPSNLSKAALCNKISEKLIL